MELVRTFPNEKSRNQEFIHSVSGNETWRKFKRPAFRRRGGNQIAFFILIEDKVEEKGGRTQTRKEKPLVTF